MRRRDTGADAAYWSDALDSNLEYLAKLRARLVDPAAQGTEALARPAAGYLDERFRRIIYGYSAGAPIEALAGDFADAFGVFYPDYLARYPPGHAASLHRPAFSRMTRVLSLGLLFRLEGGAAEGLVAAYDAWDFTGPPVPGHRDRICEALATALVPQGVRPSPPTGVNFPEAYAKIWEAIDPETADADRPVLLQAFVEGWFKTMDREFAAETDPFHPANFTYVGHWCFEAGAAAVLAGIDDSDLRRNEYYPRDLVDYARNASK